MIKCLVFLFCCIMPYAAEAGEILNVQDGFQLVKTVKLGRGKAYSVATDASLNTGAGGTQIKNCPANCADCEDSDCCPTGRILSDSYPYPCVPETCEAGTYRSGSNLCESCPSGTYSSGSYQGSCRPCSDIQVNIGSNQYVNCSACSSTGSCISYSCPAGYYLKKSGSGCEKCPDGCSACSDSSMGVYCTARSSGTWSSGGTATSCSSCSTLYTSAGSNTCTSCTTTGTCTGFNSGSGSNSGSSSSGSSCNSGGATATSPTNCPQGYGWGGSGCVTSSSQCKVCSQGSSLGGYCNCPAGSPSDGRGGCGRSCSYPYSNYCSSGSLQSGKCCRSSSDCYSYSSGNCI